MGKQTTEVTHMIIRGKSLRIGDTITYRASATSVHNPHAPEQPPTGTRYHGIIVEFNRYLIGVRSGGPHSSTPLYYVYPGDILSIRSQKSNISHLPSNPRNN